MNGGEPVNAEANGPAEIGTPVKPVNRGVTERISSKRLVVVAGVSGYFCRSISDSRTSDNNHDCDKDLTAIERRFLLSHRLRLSVIYDYYNAYIFVGSRFIMLQSAMELGFRLTDDPCAYDESLGPWGFGIFPGARQS
jgi:hypothetical protein